MHSSPSDVFSTASFPAEDEPASALAEAPVEVRGFWHVNRPRDACVTNLGLDFRFLAHLLVLAEGVLPIRSVPVA